MKKERKIDLFLDKILERNENFSACCDNLEYLKYRSFIKEYYENYSKVVLEDLVQIMNGLETKESREKFTNLMNRQLSLFYKDLEDERAVYIPEIQLVLESMQGYMIAKKDGLDLKEYCIILQEKQPFGDEGKQGSWIQSKLIEIYGSEQSSEQ